MRICLLAIATFCCASLSDIVSQTDWSGNHGVLGPVSSWSSDYYSIYDLVGTADSIMLETLLMENTIAPLTELDAILAFDTNNDLACDIVACNDGTFIFLINSTTNPGESFPEQYTYTISACDFIELCSANIDGDNDTDVIYTVFDYPALDQPGSVYCLVNPHEGTGTNWYARHIADLTGARSPCSGDIDGDGDTDIAAVGFFSNQVVWFRNLTGTGSSWESCIILNGFKNPMAVDLSDFNQDGYPDMVVVSGYEGMKVLINPGNGSSNWAVQTVSQQNLSDVSCADIDSDGDADIVACSYMNSFLWWWENKDGSGTDWEQHIISNNVYQPDAVEVIDLNGDDLQDVFSYSNHGFSWWLKTGEGDVNWTGSSYSFYNVHSEFTSMGDFDSDGHFDVVGNDEDLSWWNLSTFQPSGTLVSSILDAGKSVNWESFSIISNVPDGTSTGFQFRASDNPLNMGTWSEINYSQNSSLTDLVNSPSRYLQYRAVMESSDQALSPSLDEIAISYSERESYQWNASAVSNPVYGELSLSLSVSQQENVEITVYDLSGRLVYHQSQEYIPGIHSIEITDVPSGVYHFNVESESFNTSNQVVLIH